MANELVTKFLPLVDEAFATESKTAILCKAAFQFPGDANEVIIWKTTSAPLTDYNRNSELSEGNWSRYGEVQRLQHSVERFTMQRDRSFAIESDRLDINETQGILDASAILARQVRERIIPERDKYCISVLADNAGLTGDEAELTADNIFDKIVFANAAMDNAEVPEAGRVLVVGADVYKLIKKSHDIVMNTDVGSDMRLKGVIGNLDGLIILKVPASYMPDGVGFMIVHPCVAAAPEKLNSYVVHDNPPGINGTLIEGRIVYDVFCLENKLDAIFLQKVPVSGETGATGETA